MKNVFRVLATQSRRLFSPLCAIALAAVIGFSMTACDDGSGTTGGGDTYTVTVNNGSGSGSYAPGANVTITATVPSGQFTNWTVNSGGATLANVNSQSTSFTMPANNVTVTANFTGGGNPGATYAVTVNGGSGSGNYGIGANVNISAIVPSGQTFVNWTVNSGGATLANANSASTSFTMPANAVTVTANFSGGSGGNTTINIVNNTTYAIMDVRIKPSTSSSWGSDRETGILANGATKSYTLLPPYSSTNQYDIRLMETSTDTGGNNFRKYKVTVSNGMTITFNAADLDNGSTLPTIYFRNRTGITVTSVRVRPSGTSDDWTTFTATVENNNQSNDGKGISLAMPIPQSSYSVFDFELISSNPVNTFRKSNVTIANGTVLQFTSAEAATPIVGYPTIVIENNTGTYLSFIYIAPQVSGGSWGSNLLPSGNIGNGQTYAFTLSKTLSEQDKYAIRAQVTTFAGNGVYVKNNITVTEGMVVTIVAADKE